MGGFAVITFTDPKGALSYIDNNIDAITLIIADLRMPILTGKQLLDYLKKTYPECVVIMTSEYYLDEEKEQLLRMGATDVFKKMYDTDEILNKVKDIISSHGTENIVRS